MSFDGSSELPEWFKPVLDMSRSILRMYFQKGLPDSLVEIVLKDMAEAYDTGVSVEDLVVLFEVGIILLITSSQYFGYRQTDYRICCEQN